MIGQETTNVERAEQGLFALLAKGQLQPGQRLVESRLAKQLKLSRHAVREALNRMVSSELVEYIPYTGYRLRQVTASDLMELYELREAIEPIAARDAADLGDPRAIEKMTQAHQRFGQLVAGGDWVALWRADCDFHFAMIEGSGNRRFTRLCEHFRIEASLMPRAFGHDEEAPPLPDLDDPRRLRNCQDAHESHAAILEAVQQRRRVDAQQLAAEHIFYAKDGFIRDHLPRMTKRERRGGEVNSTSQAQGHERKTVLPKTDTTPA